jgi:hypothetical protein
MAPKKKKKVLGLTAVSGGKYNISEIDSVSASDQACKARQIGYQAT